MENENKITPVGLKGREINERMIQLMGIKPINENNSKSVVELTKIGPDGIAYAIVRENHEYYIKTSMKKSNLITEDFGYIGGLQNKKSEVYPSYAKAIKHLNLKFNSLSESLDKGHNINVFENDNLLKENGIAGFSNYGGNGFSNEGNLEGNIPLFEEEEDVELTEVEKAVDEMLTGHQDKLDVVPDGVINAKDLAKLRADKDKVNERKLTINRALKNMDSIIDSLTEGTVKKKVYTLK
jgi:hypothetical protein